jgi:aspartate kinase
MLTVEKIGGTSMSSMKDVLSNIILFNRSKDNLYNRIFVVSAYSGVTNWLLENKKTGEPGIYHQIAEHKEYHQSLNEITLKLKELNKSFESLGLNLEAADNFIEQRIRDADNYLQHLSSILASGYVSDESILQAAREILASIGEAHSAFNLTNVLRNKNINATFIDLSGFHDHQSLTINQRIESAFKDIEFEKTICIVTGYTKGTEGIMREFDRGYSEVTFSKIAVLTHADEAIIHKEYHLSSADPAIVGIEHCEPIGFTNYDVADQLADVGMEAIHPKASKPLELNGINLRIKNTFQPSDPGTLITKDYICPQKKIEVIAGNDKVIILDVYDPLMVGSVGADFRIMEILKEYDISYIFKTTSANNISTVIWEKDLHPEWIDKLKRHFERITIEKVAIVCIIGTNMDKPGVLANISNSLADYSINIKSGGFSLRKVNIQLVVSREDYKNTIIALNKNRLI